MVELVLGIHSWYSEMFLGTQASGEEVGWGSVLESMILVGSEGGEAPA